MNHARQGMGKCIEWTKGLDCWGYGKAKRRGVTVGAHRLAWIDANGPVPKGMFVLHRCDNRACVNVDHLFLGTHKVNMADMTQKCRQARGQKLPQTRLNEWQVVGVIGRILMGEQKAQIARTLGVTPTMIVSIWKGRKWAYLFEEDNP